MTRHFAILPADSGRPAPDPWCWRDDWHAPGESAFSLLAKFQRLNALSCAALTGSFANRNGRRAPPKSSDLRDARCFDLPRMGDALRLPLADLAEAFVMPSGALQRISVPTLRWCVRCAQQGIHLTVFQYRYIDRCPLHQIPLLARCEGCSEPIGYRLRADLFKAPFNCPYCGRPWWAPARGLDDIRVAQDYRRRLGTRASHVSLHVRGPPETMDATWCTAAGIPATPVELPSLMEYPLPPEEVCWLRYGRGVPEAGAWPTDAEADICDDGRDPSAHACYKAVRRRIMRVYAKAHRDCIRSTEGHFAWSLCARTTTPCCAVALAFVRWRCKWEGVRIPRSLLQKPVHGPLGLTVWLSLYAPVAPGTWSREAARWLTLHALAHACIDSFRTYLDEAQGVGRMLWLPFPVHDFPRRANMIRRAVSLDDVPQALCILPSRASYSDLPPERRKATTGHRREHLERLRRNVNPVSGELDVPRSEVRP